MRFCLDLKRLVFVVEDPRLLYFVEIVILRGKPKYRDSRNPLVAQFLRHPDGCQSLVDGENGSAVEAHLLAGCHDDSIFLRQAVEARGGLGPGSGVLLAQRADQSSAVLSRDLDPPGGGRELIRQRRMLIETADLAKRINVILKETLGRRDFRVPNAGGFHVPEGKRRGSTRPD